MSHVFFLCLISLNMIEYFLLDHIDPTKTLSPILPNQFTSSKTNIVFNQMQLGLQVKISSQLKLIRPLMTLETVSVAAAHLGSSVAWCGCCQANWSDPTDLWLHTTLAPHQLAAASYAAARLYNWMGVSGDMEPAGLWVLPLFFSSSLYYILHAFLSLFPQRPPTPLSPSGLCLPNIRRLASMSSPPILDSYFPALSALWGHGVHESEERRHLWFKVLRV